VSDCELDAELVVGTRAVLERQRARAKPEDHLGIRGGRCTVNALARIPAELARGSCRLVGVRLPPLEA
jgi:hypothetical protein